MYRVRSNAGLGGYEFLANPFAYTEAEWCTTFPSLCSPATYQASMVYLNPEVIAPILPPPAVPAVGAGLSTTPAPYPCSDGSMATAATNCPSYSAAVDAAIAQQQTDWQIQNAATVAQTQANLDAIAAGQGTTNWFLYGGIALAAVLGVSMLKGRAR